jgi:hypothetical protein
MNDAEVTPANSCGVSHDNSCWRLFGEVFFRRGREKKKRFDQSNAAANSSDSRKQLLQRKQGTQVFLRNANLTLPTTPQTTG